MILVKYQSFKVNSNKLIRYFKENILFFIYNFFIIQLPNLGLLLSDYLISPILTLTFGLFIFTKISMVIGIILISFLNIFLVPEIPPEEMFYLISNFKNNQINSEIYSYIGVILFSSLLSILLLFFYKRIFKGILISSSILIFFLFYYYQFLSDEKKNDIKQIKIIDNNINYIHKLRQSKIFGHMNLKELILFLTRNKSKNIIYENNITKMIDQAISNNGDIFIVINESGAFFKNEIINNKLLSYIYSEKKYYDYEHLEWSLMASTVGAELQVICGITSKKTIELIKSKNQKFSILNKAYNNGLCNTLDKAHKNNYQSIYIHSAMCDFNSRCDYKNIFDKAIFYKDLDILNKNINDCNWGWKGKCDDEIAVLIGDLFNTNKNKKIVTFLTVNNHLPIISSKPSKFKCDEFYNLKNSDVLCNFAKNNANLFISIKENVLNTFKKNDLLILVGDHPPYAFNKSEKYKIEQSTTRIYYYQIK